MAFSPGSHAVDVTAELKWQFPSQEATKEENKKNSTHDVAIFL